MLKQENPTIPTHPDSTVNLPPQTGLHSTERAQQQYPASAKSSVPCVLLTMLIFVILQLCVAIAVDVYKIILNYIGFNETAALVVDQANCAGYLALVGYEQKQLYIMKISLVMTGICVLTSLVELIVVSVLIHRSRNLDPEEPEELETGTLHRISGAKTRALLYILQSISWLSMIVVVGYYLIYFMNFQMISCAWTSTDTNLNILVIAGLAAAGFVLAFILWLIIVVVNIKNRVDSEEKYKQEEEGDTKADYQKLLNNTEPNNTFGDQAHGKQEKVDEKQEEPQPIQKVRTLDSEKQETGPETKQGYISKNKLYTPENQKYEPEKQGYVINAPDGPRVRSYLYKEPIKPEDPYRRQPDPNPIYKSPVRQEHSKKQPNSSIYKSPVSPFKDAPHRSPDPVPKQPIRPVAGSREPEQVYQYPIRELREAPRRAPEPIYNEAIREAPRKQSEYSSTYKDPITPIQQEPEIYQSYDMENRPNGSRNPIFGSRKQLYDSPYNRIENGKHYMGDRKDIRPDMQPIDENYKEDQYQRPLYPTQPDPKEEQDYFRPVNSRKILPESSNSGRNNYEGSKQGRLHDTYFKDEMMNKRRKTDAKRKGILNDYIQGRMMDNE